MLCHTQKQSVSTQTVKETRVLAATVLAEITTIPTNYTASADE